MKPFLRLWEMAKRTRLAGMYTAALNGLCYDPLDWSDALVLADMLEESGDAGYAEMIRAAQQSQEIDDLDPLKVGFIKRWNALQNEMTARNKSRTMPYLLDITAGGKSPGPTFYYTQTIKMYDRTKEFYVRFNVRNCSFTWESSETGVVKKVNPEQLDEYILRCSLAFRLRYIVN